jgi:SpoVK/Ycf46/Vps4 family AAA+-type ATPase
MDNFKFRSLKSYSSNEWLYESKKYRAVFDANETKYIYFEFAFYNKKFDDVEWTANMKFKAYSVGTSRKEICKLEQNRVVRSEENIVFVRDGWGMEKEGVFWKEGEYCWEAYLDDELIGTTYFYIYNVGKVSSQENKYFNIRSIRLYEGPDANIPIGARTYLSSFNAKQTRYVWVECAVDNKLDKDWMCELVFNFTNSAHQLKGSSVRMSKINNGMGFVFESGWGSDALGTWYEDGYTLEILFMDTLLAVVPLDMGDEMIEGEAPVFFATSEYTPAMFAGSSVELDETKKTLDELLAELDHLIGLEDIKKEVKEDYIQYLNFLKLRKEKGIEEEGSIPLHSVFTGNPGTGKTTVARLLGKIFNRMGLLSKGHVHEVDRADLVAEYIGQTAPKVKEAIEKARGGILFIDEAYSLYRSGEDSKDFGREVIEIVMKEMSDGPGDIAIFVAGYPKEMETFLESNPGLKSRFNHYFDFPDYTPQELKEIAMMNVNDMKLKIDDNAMTFLYKKLVDAYRSRTKSFGNARMVKSIIGESKMNMGLRLMKNEHVKDLTIDELNTITEADIVEVYEDTRHKKPDIPVDYESLAESLAELNALTGLNNVKKEVNELVKLVKYYKEEKKDVLKKFSLHTVFTGNPGTGKTTVARILAKIYKSLGILERGELIECDRERLVGGFLGQTAIKTNEMIERAKGSVLFIDEAYTLSQGSPGDYGYEAIDTLLKRMEDMRGELIVIVAGYPDRMAQFLESNPGLKSRFDRKIDFEDYSPEDMMVIVDGMLAKEELSLDAAAREHIVGYMDQLIRFKNKYFGNARAVRKIVEQIVKNQNLRLASLTPKQRTAKMKSLVTIEDVKEFDINKDNSMESGKGAKIGF